MFYLTSKLLIWALQPLTLVFLALLAAIWCIHRCRFVIATRLVATCAALILIGGTSPLSTVMLLVLEERFPRPVLAPDAPVTGIVVLGGAEESRIAMSRGIPMLNEAGERVTDALALARRFPRSRIMFSSGSTEIVNTPTVGADSAEMFFLDQGFDMSRVTFERRSRNTHENAIFLREMVKPRDGELWLVVTSAYHMPRSVAVFRAIGWELMPWPTDYRTEGWKTALQPFVNPLEGFRRLEVALKEWVGLVAYRVTGRTRELFPSPKP